MPVSTGHTINPGGRTEPTKGRRGGWCGEQEAMTEQTTIPLRDIRHTWTEFRRNPSQSLRNVLIENYLHLVRYHAERLKTKLPSAVDVQDLQSEAVFGLMDAIENFDPSRSVKFETFSAIRIRGAMFDWLREQDWVPRLVRQRFDMIHTATEDLHAQLGRFPSDEEIRKHLKLSKPEFRRIMGDSNPPPTVSLSRISRQGEHRDELEIDTIVDKRQSMPDEAITSKDAVDFAFKGLSRAERLVMGLYHIDDMTMKETGGSVGLSESRISQLNGSLIERARARFDRQPNDICSILPDFVVERVAVEGTQKSPSIERPITRLRTRRHTRHRGSGNTRSTVVAA